MKIKIYAIFLPFLFLSCQKTELQSILTPRVLTENETFNSYMKNDGDSLTIFKVNEESADNGSDKNEKLFKVKFGDTVLKIKTNPKDSSMVSETFSYAQFVNSQKTSLLVQSSGSGNEVAPFYLITLRGDKQPDVVSLDRPSNGNEDSRFKKGLAKVGATGYLINNDFFVTNVNAKVYFIKRQNDEERIPGLFLLNSPDKHTLVFLIGSSFYQVHYPTNEVFVQPLGASVPKEPVALLNWVQNNYIWKKNKKEISFLVENQDDDRIRDISEFNKKK
jgi:hypothetical protein